MQEGSRKAIMAAFFANLGIAIAKFAAFAITGAAS
ncbi:MAG: cation transporter, partial [Actinobacteria bacterium]|nr:cation transporter [Actinomycetota bacterium]